MNHRWLICAVGCEEGAIRLQGRGSSMVGRVEICYNDEWASVCDHQWNIEETQVACKQLGFDAG